MVKYTTALRLGTAETEAILRRFTRNNVQHPTYTALSELGRAIKTIFLARYLHSLALRREIHEGLNTIERWNGANDFVYFARRGEMTSNRREDQEISMLSLHLLQNCMVYVNTLMLQRVLVRAVVVREADARGPARPDAADLRPRQPLRGVPPRHGHPPGDRHRRGIGRVAVYFAAGDTNVGFRPKTLYLLSYLDDETYRRRILTQLNRGEGRHSVARTVFHGQRGELRQRYREGQEDQLGALGLVVNVLVLWNTLYMDAALAHLRRTGAEVQPKDMARLSPLGHEHINVLGHTTFALADRIAQGELRPLRHPDDGDDLTSRRGLAYVSVPMIVGPRSASGPEAEHGVNPKTNV